MTYEEAIKLLNSVTIYYGGKCTRTALDLAIEALDKHIPKKPTNFSIDNNDGYTIYDCECPSCEQSHRELFPFAFCIHCGQALEWEE